MEETDTLQTLPPNFISLQKLQELRIKEKQQKQQQQDDEDTKKRLAEAAELERGKLVVVSDEIKNTASAKGFYKKKKKKKLGHRPKLQEQELGAAAIEERVVDLDQESKQNMKAKMKKKKKNREKEGESMVEKQTEVGKGGESAAEITRSVNPTVEVTLDKKKPKSNGWKKKTVYRNRNSSGTTDIGNIAVSGDSGGNKRSSRSSKIEVRNGDFMKGRRKGGENLMWVKKEGIKSDGGDANRV